MLIYRIVQMKRLFLDHVVGIIIRLGVNLLKCLCQYKLSDKTFGVIRMNNDGVCECLSVRKLFFDVISIPLIYLVRFNLHVIDFGNV